MIDLTTGGPGTDPAMPADPDRADGPAAQDGLRAAAAGWVTLVTALAGLHPEDLPDPAHPG